MYAIRHSPSIQNDIARGWSAWMGMRYVSFLDLIDTAAEVDEYDFAEWADAHDLDPAAEVTAEQYVTDKLDWDVRIDPATAEICVVHHDGLSVYKVDEEDLAVNIKTARSWQAGALFPTGQGHATIGKVTVIATFGSWSVLEVEDTILEM